LPWPFHLCNGDCEHSDKGFGDDGHGDTDTVDEYLTANLPFGGRKNDDGKEDSETKQEKGKLAQGNLQRCSHKSKNGLNTTNKSPAHFHEERFFTFFVVLLLPKHDSDLADFGLHTCRDYDTATATGSHFAARECEICSVTGAHVGIVELLLGCLFHRDGFTCKEGFVRKGVDTIDEAEVSGYDAANTELYNVTRDKIDSLHFDIGYAVTGDGGFRGGELLERFDGLLSLIVLPEPDNDV
jgi:hypothetical protein